MNVARHLATATAFYARVTREESQELSIPNQTKRFQELAQEKRWDGELFVEDDPVHGDWDADRRPALRRLLEAVEAGTIRRVVVRHLDRLGRGRVLEDLIERLSSRSIEVCTFDGPLDLRSSAGRLSVRAQAMVGAFEIERTGERIREMKRQKARGGIYVGPTPFGYTSQARVQRELTPVLGEDEARRQAEGQHPHRGDLVVDEAEALVVRLVFGLYVNEGWGTRKIGQYLTAKGLRTRNGAVWSTQQIRAMVKNPLYAGYVTFDEVGFKEARKAFNPVHVQPRYPGKHPAIIDTDTFAKSETRWSAISKREVTARPATYALSGLSVCPHGHRVKARASEAGSRAYYTCTKRAIYGPRVEDGGCTATPMHTETAEAAVANALAELFADPASLHRNLAAAARAREPERVRHDADDRAAVAGALAQEETAVARCTQLLLAATPGSGVEEVLLARLNEGQGRVVALRAQLEDQPASQVVVLPTVPTKGQVAALCEDLAARLDEGGLQELLQLMAEHHGLVVTIVDATRLLVELDIEVKGRSAHLAVEVALEAAPSNDEWVAATQATAPTCGCGCGEAIVVRPRHRSKGLPSYIKGHTPGAAGPIREAANAEGWLTITQAASRLGIGVNTMRRRVARGDYEARTVKARRNVMTLVAESGLLPEAVKRLTSPEFAKALGIARSRLRWFERQGVLPEPTKEASGKRLYAQGEVVPARRAIAEWEAAQAAALEAEGWVTRVRAIRELGVSPKALGRLVARGDVAQEMRPVASGRVVAVVRVDDLG